MARSLDDVRGQMARVGIVVPASHELVVSGRTYRRFRPDGQKATKKSAWYRIYENRTDKGRVFYSGSYGIRNESYLIEASFDGWSLEERAEAQKRAQAAARQAEADRRKLAGAAADKAARLWARGRTEVDAAHPYLARKQVRAYGLREFLGKLLVPMRRADGVLAGLQLILPAKNEDGTDKLFLTGSEKTGTFHVLGEIEGADVVLFGEGYATCASVHAACGKPVVVCFDAGNIEPVLKAFRALYPNTRFIIAGDDDRHLVPRYRARLARHGIEGCEIDGELHSFAHPELGAITVRAAWKTERKTGLFRIEGEIVYTRGEREIREPLAIENAGRMKASAAAAAHRCEQVFPAFAAKDAAGTDFNDLQLAEGEERVRAQLAEALQTPSDSAPAQRRDKGAGGEAGPFRRFTLIYGTDTLWDAHTRDIIRVANAKLAYRKAIDAWLDSPNRQMIRQDQLVFAPHGHVPEGCINLFDRLPLAPDIRKPHHLIVEHLMMLCDGDEGLFDWVAKWLAYPLQHPGTKMHTALIMHGRREGTGKSILFDQVMVPIYGRYAKVINQALLNSDFNGWVSRLLFCVADEVLSQQERKHQKGLLKGLITGGAHNINEKNLPVRTEPNFTNLTFISNEIMPVMLDELDRRYTVAYIDKPQPPGYYAELVAQIESGGIAGFYGWLLNYPLGDFGPASRPYENKARRRLITLGMSPERKFYEFWSGGLTDLPFEPCAAKHLYAAFQGWCKVNGERFVPNSTVFGATLGLLMPKRKVRVDLYPAGYDATDPHAGDAQLVSYQGMVYLPPRAPGDADPQAPPASWSDEDIQFGVLKFQKAVDSMAREVRRVVF